MRYSGYIDNLLADAAFAKKTNDASWLQDRLSYEEDPIKRMLLNVVCNPVFIQSVKREGTWLRKTKTYLENLALELMENEDYFNAEEMNRHAQELVKEQQDDSESVVGDDAVDIDLEEFLSDWSYAEDEDEEYQSSKGMASGANNKEDDSEDPKEEDDDKGEGKQERDRRKRWENMRKRAMDKFRSKDEENDAQDSVNDFEKKFDKDTQDYSRPLVRPWYSSEYVREVETDLLSRIPKSLKKLARMIGRTGGFGIEQGRSFSRAAKSDISGITVGDDLNSLLPSEIAMLSEKKTQDIFYRNYAEKRLQVFASASSGEKKVLRRDGPVIICLDTSSSMNGEPAAVARMLTIAVAIYAMRRRRKVMVMKYSTNYSCESFTRVKEIDKLMNFLRWRGVGGNDENRMFSYLFEKRLPEEPEFDAADILCISDFGWVPLDDDVKQLIADAKAGGMKFYGLGVNMHSCGGGMDDEAINICDSKWEWQGNECKQIEDRYSKK